MLATSACEDVIPRCVRVRETSTACELIAGTGWFGMACMRICSTGEIGVVNELMPTRRRAAQSVVATVTGEEERARDEIYSDRL